MLIGIDASRANRDVKTGVEWYSYYIIQELKKITPDSIRVFLYTDKKLKGELAELPAGWQEKILNPPSLKLWRARWQFNYLWTQGRLSLEMIFNPPDVLFVPSAALPIICPKKSFTTIHDVGFAKFPEFYGFFQRLYLNFSTRFALKKCAKIFVPSEFTKKELVKYYKVDENKIVVTPLGVVGDENGFTKPYISVGFRKPSSQGNGMVDDNFILFIGRLSEKKNISRIIEAFQLFKIENQNSNLKLVLVGSSKNESVLSVIKKSAGNIVHFNWLPPKEISQLLGKAKALIFPSLYEGFGLPILEAFAAGTPVITSKGIATEEVARDAALLVNPLSVVEIKEAILKITSDNALRQNLIQKGLERVKDFSWNKTAEITWESIREYLK